MRVRRWYEALDKYPGARKNAERIAALETAYFVRRLHHEASAIFLPLADSMKGAGGGGGGRR